MRGARGARFELRVQTRPLHSSQTNSPGYGIKPHLNLSSSGQLVSGEREIEGVLRSRQGVHCLQSQGWGTPNPMLSGGLAWLLNGKKGGPTVSPRLKFQLVLFPNRRHFWYLHGHGSYSHQEMNHFSRKALVAKETALYVLSEGTLLSETSAFQP